MFRFVRLPPAGSPPIHATAHRFGPPLEGLLRRRCWHTSLDRIFWGVVPSQRSHPRWTGGGCAIPSRPISPAPEPRPSVPVILDGEPRTFADAAHTQTEHIAAVGV